MSSPPIIQQALAMARLDWTPISQPASKSRTALASALAVIVALAANVGIVHVATRPSSSIREFSHFHFVDYGSLTILGVVSACATWFVVSRISSSPRWLFVRLCVAVTVVSWVPDVWLIARGEPLRAVLVLMIMHLVTAVLTYNILVRVAPVRAVSFDLALLVAPGPEPLAASDAERSRAVGFAAVGAQFGRATWLVMTVAVGIEFLLGVGEFFYVPYNRPDGFIATHGEAISLVHALVGAFLGIGATTIVLLVARGDRSTRAVAMGGFIGVMLGAIGGTITYVHSLRILGMGLMFVGAGVACFSYLIPLVADPTQGQNAPDNHI